MTTDFASYISSFPLVRRSTLGYTQFLASRAYFTRLNFEKEKVPLFPLLTLPVNSHAVIDYPFRYRANNEAGVYRRVCACN